jgi:hypothetical protein
MKLGVPQSKTGYYREEKNIVLARIQIPHHPVQCMVTVLTTLTWVNIASYQNLY